MGLTIQASSSSGNPPELEDGLYDARFDGVRAEELENSQFGDNKVFIWDFTLFEDGKAIREERDDHEKFGEPIEVQGMTSRSTNTKSKTTPRAVRYLKGIMSAEEFEAFVAEKPVDVDALVGRMVQVQVELKENGWAKVTDVLPAKKARSRRQASED
ncbi:MAG TPA: hypothetical protein VFI40_04760 [Nocardioides sp.]|nr:hypothetical protein [Nocardioides sp.]